MPIWEAPGGLEDCVSHVNILAKLTDVPSPDLFATRTEYDGWCSSVAAWHRSPMYVSAEGFRGRVLQSIDKHAAQVAEPLLKLMVDWWGMELSQEVRVIPVGEASKCKC